MFFPRENSYPPEIMIRTNNINHRLSIQTRYPLHGLHETGKGSNGIFQGPAFNDSPSPADILDGKDPGPFHAFRCAWADVLKS